MDCRITFASYEPYLVETDNNCWNQCLLPCKETVYDVVSNSARWPHISYLYSIKKQYLKDWQYIGNTDDIMIISEGGLNFHDIHVQKYRPPPNDSIKIGKENKLTDVVNDKLMKINIVIENKHPIAWYEKQDVHSGCVPFAVRRNDELVARYHGLVPHRDHRSDL